MVLSATVRKEASFGIQKVVMGSIGAVGISIAISTASPANELHLNGPNINGPTLQAPVHIEHLLETVTAPEITEESIEALTAAEREAAADRAGLERLRARLLSPKPIAEATAPPAHGTYLYGQQPIADQPETAYFVFESQGEQVIGALYMPSSSFDCVQGRIIDQRMALSVTDSYTRETYSYSLALNAPLTEVASQTSNVTPPPNIEGFYPLPVREQDRAILATCQMI